MQKEIDQVMKQLLEKVQVCVVWDGYNDSSKKEENYDAYVSTNLAFCFEEVYESAMDPNLSGVVEYKTLIDQCKKLHEKLNELAIRVIGRAKSMNQPINKIPENYFNMVARTFVQRNKQSCVIEAPDLWLPSLRFQG